MAILEELLWSTGEVTEGEHPRARAARHNYILRQGPVWIDIAGTITCK